MKKLLNKMITDNGAKLDLGFMALVALVLINAIGCICALAVVL